MAISREERLRQADKQRAVPKPKQPAPAKNVGDQTPNPLPDDPRDRGGEGGGDAGRSS
jgi:hypothetical protein